MWNGWNQPPEPFLISQICVEPGAGLASGAPYLELMTSTQVVPFTVQLELLRTSSILKVVGPSLRPITSVFGLSTDGIEFFARLVGSAFRTSNCMTSLMKS